MDKEQLLLDAYMLLKMFIIEFEPIVSPELVRYKYLIEKAKTILNKIQEIQE